MSLNIKIEQTKGWFVKADNDIQVAEILLGASAFLPDEIAFHCQQSIEKSIKGFRFWHGLKFLQVHDLSQLSQDCIAIDATLDPILKQTSPLTQYAVVYRYPGQIVHPSRKEVEDMTLLARTVWTEALARLPKEVKP